MTLIENYIKEKDVSHQAKLFQMYHLIKECAPMTEETLTWGMPTFKVNGNLVHFADNKTYVGFYPGSSGVSEFEPDLKDYKHSKGAIHFPYNQDLPVDLIKRIILFRLDENLNYKK